jgi:hypothetical protein
VNGFPTIRLATNQGVSAEPRALRAPAAAKGAAAGEQANTGVGREVTLKLRMAGAYRAAS